MKQLDQDLSSYEVAYQIKVQGQLDEEWSNWFSGMAVKFENEGDVPPMTTLTGVVDQSALHGILARIRDLNLKLVSVARIESDKDRSYDSKEVNNGKTLENGVA